MLSNWDFINANKCIMQIPILIKHIATSLFLLRYALCQRCKPFYIDVMREKPIYFSVLVGLRYVPTADLDGKCLFF